MFNLNYWAMIVGDDYEDTLVFYFLVVGYNIKLYFKCGIYISLVVRDLRLIGINLLQHASPPSFESNCGAIDNNDKSSYRPVSGPITTTTGC